jgi:hypothetical protein
MKKLHVACLALVLAAQVTIACGEELPGTPPEEGDSSTGNKGNTGNTSNTGATDAGGGDGPSSGGKGGKGSGGKAPTGGTQGQGGGEDDLFAHCNQPWSGEPPPVETECDLDALEDSGVTLTTADISAGMTLESGKTYELSGTTRILPGEKLTIPPCVKIIGQTPESILVAMAGNETVESGQLIAVGEPMAPIIFTSAQEPGNRRPGDWGGVMLLGRAEVNNHIGGERPKAEGIVEGDEPYGWVDDEFNDDSSGSLAYVRIEYASRQINVDSETNGLTFAGVGTGTSAHHVMVSNSADDCFEWFGGKMDAHHLIAFNCDDDMFDTDAGFTGSIQFAFGRMYPTTAETDSNGFEMDNLSTNTDAEPRTAARWSNVTLCGNQEREASPADKRYGMVLRRGVGGSITNTLVTGFLAAFSKRNASIVSLTHVSQFDNLGAYALVANDDSAGWFEAEETNSAEAPDRLCDCWADPPLPFAASPVAGADPGFGDTGATYRGAFKDASAESNWMTGLWVDWSDE